MDHTCCCCFVLSLAALASLPRKQTPGARGYVFVANDKFLPVMYADWKNTRSKTVACVRCLPCHVYTSAVSGVFFLDITLIFPPIDIQHKQKCPCRCLLERPLALWSQITRQRYTLRIGQGIWPCNANHNEHSGKAYASQHTRPFCNEKQKQKITKKRQKRGKKKERQESAMPGKGKT